MQTLNFSLSNLSIAACTIYEIINKSKFILIKIMTRVFISGEYP